MIAQVGPAEDKYIYLQTERQESDEESENQEEVWLNATASDIFEAEAYGVQRTDKVSKGIRGAPRDNYSRLKADRAKDATRRSDAVKGGSGKHASHQNISRDAPDLGNRGSKQVPFDVHQDVFDAKDDDDLVPMAIDEARRDDEGEKEREPMAGGVNSTAGKVVQIGTGTGSSQDALVKEIMKTPLTIDLGTLVGIAPSVKRGLVSAVRDTSGSPAPAYQKRSAPTKGVDTSGRGHSGPPNASALPKAVNLTVARDDLLKIQVYLGDAVATAIIDTGSQLNLISEKKFVESGLVRTEESTVSVTGATGGSNTCLGMIPEAEIYISAKKLAMMGPEIHVIEDPPFDVLLGRVWLTLNGVSIEERKEGTCLKLEVDG